MSTLKSIIFETLPDAEEYYETAEALRDLDRQYEHFTRTVWKASKQLLKFDEINRLVATEVEEKAASTGSGRSSSGSSSKSSSTSSTKKTTEKTPDTEATTPDLSRDYALKFNIVDFLFGWTGLDWEKVMAGLVAGLTGRLSCVRGLLFCHSGILCVLLLRRRFLAVRRLLRVVRRGILRAGLALRTCPFRHSLAAVKYSLYALSAGCGFGYGDYKACQLYQLHKYLRHIVIKCNHLSL